jgi:hypothetical protein
MAKLVKKGALLDAKRKEHDILLKEERRKMREGIEKKNFELAGERLALRREIENHNKELKNEKLKMEEGERAFQLKKRDEREAVKKNLTKQIGDKMEKRLKDKERLIRAQMKGEYDLMLKKKLQERDEELKKKRFALEMEIQRKAKEALGY